MTENIELLVKRLKPRSGNELIAWTRQFPEELGYRLLVEYWELLLPKKVDLGGAVGWWGTFQERFDPSKGHFIPKTPEEIRIFIEAEQTRREENLREYLAKLDAEEAARG